MSLNKRILSEVEGYYSSKIKEHGISAKGVDWNSEASQELRFEILIKVIEEDYFSLLDYGCGYGALFNFLNSRFSKITYTGFDISEEMLSKAAEHTHGNSAVKWTPTLKDQVYDYCIASGVFNVKLLHSPSSWKEYIKEALIEIDRRTKKGFSFNMLTKYSDKKLMRDTLFYADPGYYFDFCKKNFSKKVALLHDYPLYEFSIIVRK